MAVPLPAWAQRCSCGGQGITHLHADRHEPIGPADVDPHAGRACDLCGDYVTGVCPTCASTAIAAVARVRELLPRDSANDRWTTVEATEVRDALNAEGVPDAAS